MGGEILSFSMHINLREVIAEFDEIEDRVGDLTPVLKKIGVYMVQRAKKRFADSGPGWPPLSPATIARRRGGSPKPLWDTGRLLSSIGILTSDRKEVKVGTNVIYAAVQQFGAKKGAFGEKDVKVRAHTRNYKGRKITVREHTRRQRLPWGDIPARPFLVIEGADISIIENILRDYLLRGGR